MTNLPEKARECVKLIERSAEYTKLHHLLLVRMECHILAAMRDIVEPLEEMHRMQLAAISSASIQNTENTVKENRIDRSNPYWTVAYDDVCRAVDREMQLLVKVNELEWEFK